MTDCMVGLAVEQGWGGTPDSVALVVNSPGGSPGTSCMQATGSLHFVMPHVRLLSFPRSTKLAYSRTDPRTRGEEEGPSIEFRGGCCGFRGLLVRQGQGLMFGDSIY